MYLSDVYESYDDITCPWCGQDTLSVELNSCDSETELELTLNCYSCEEYITYRYICNIDIEAFAEENDLLYAQIDEAKCLADIYDPDNEDPFDEIEVEVYDDTFGVQYTLQADLQDTNSEGTGDILSASIFKIDRDVLKNVANEVVSREENQYLDIYLTENAPDTMSLLIECLEEACKEQQKEILLDPFTRYIQSFQS